VLGETTLKAADDVAELVTQIVHYKSALTVVGGGGKIDPLAAVVKLLKGPRPAVGRFADA